MHTQLEVLTSVHMAFWFRLSYFVFIRLLVVDGATLSKNPNHCFSDSRLR